MAGGFSVSGVLDEAAFRAFVEQLVADHRVVGPRVRDSSIVLDELGGPDDLPEGHTLDQAPGRCRLHPLPEGDRRRFAWAVGPTSPKAVQHPPQRRLFAAEVDDDGFRVVDGADPPDGAGRTAPTPLALVGVRPCDVAAMGVLQRVLGDATEAGDAVVVAVNCTEPGGTCFCASMGTGPVLDDQGRDSVDIELWEQPGDDGPRYLVGHRSIRGAELLAGIELRPAPEEAGAWVAAAQERAVSTMGRTLATGGLAADLLGALGSGRWEEVASRCLSCGNCTMVCPTCFCHSVHDVSELGGGRVERWSRWDSCFSLDHSYVHGGSVRATTADRYRQWLTHKLSTWWGQFGESGCVGCGRCTTWCPVGIDFVAEAAALAAEGAAEATRRGPAATAVLLRAREVQR